MYCTWQVKTGYTLSKILLANRLVPDYRQQHTSMNRHRFPKLIGSYIYGQTKGCFGSTKYYDNIGNYDDDLHPKIPLVILKNKDSNSAVCAHFAWSIQTGYTPPGKRRPTGRSLILLSQREQQKTAAVDQYSNHTRILQNE